MQALQIEFGIRIRGVDLTGLLQSAGGLLGAIKDQKGQPQIIVIAVRIRRSTYRCFYQICRAERVTGLECDQPCSVKSFGMIRLYAQQPAIKYQRFGQVPLLVKMDCRCQ